VIKTRFPESMQTTPCAVLSWLPDND